MVSFLKLRFKEAESRQASSGAISVAHNRQHFSTRPTKPPPSLTKLSKTFGPLMSLQLGNVFTVVVSSPEIAKEILQKQDHVCSGRSAPVAFDADDHHQFSVACLSVGKEWRKLRKICKEQLFTTHCLDANQGLRHDNLQRLSDYVQKCCDGSREVDIGEAAVVSLLNLMSATLFSAEVAKFDSDTDQELRETINGVLRCASAPNIADFFPILEPIDPQGLKRETGRYFGKLFAMFEDIIKERLEARGASLAYQKKNDFLETLLDLTQGSSQYELTTKEIKHLFLDLFLGGSGTTARTIEWAMTELLLNPEKLRKAKDELRTVIGEKKQVEESDMSRLPYLQAVIKEVFRFHPSAPFLFPHKSEKDVQVNGCIIPKDTRILVNVWEISRDPSLWPNPNTFEPERFLDRKIDYAGQDFKLIPFGSGRRICPGLPLADRIVHGMVATFIHNFDWKFEVSAEAQQVHRREVFGITLQKAVPLKAIPIKPVA